VELRQGLWQFVRRMNREGHTIVLTTHYLEEAEQHCGRIAMLKDGALAARDTTRNLLGRLPGLELRVRGRDGARTVLRLAGPDELEQALARLRAEGVEIVDLEL